MSSLSDTGRACRAVLWADLSDFLRQTLRRPVLMWLGGLIWFSFAPLVLATPALVQLSPTVYQTEHCLFVIDASVNWSSSTTAYNDLYTYPFSKLNDAYDILVAQFSGTYFSVCYVANTGDSHVPNYIDRTAKASGINESMAVGTPNTFATTDICRYNLPGGSISKSMLAVYDHELGHAWGARAFYNTAPYPSLSNGHWLPNSTVDCQMSGSYSADGYVTLNKLYGDPANGFHWQKVDNLHSNDYESFSEQTLYLMGLSKTWPTAYVLNNSVYNPDTTASYSSVDTFDHATMVAAYGARSPDYTTEQKRLKLGFVYIARDLAEVNAVYQNAELSVNQFCNGEAIDPQNYRYQTPFLCDTRFRASVDGLLSDLDSNSTPTLVVTDPYISSTDGTAVVNFVAAYPDGAAPTVSVVPASSSCAIVGSTAQLSSLPDGVHFFTLKAVDAGGKKVFGHFTVEVQHPVTSTAISVQPVGQTVTTGDSTNFSVTATGSPASVSYQWYRLAARESIWNVLSDGGAYSGSATATLTVACATTLNGDRFLCVVSNATGTATSNAALLVVNETAPVLSTQPVDHTVATGTSVSYTIVAVGVPSAFGYFNYQWQRLAAGSGTWTDLSNGGGYTGATTASLSVVSNLTMSGDQFRCVVTNTAGPTTSNLASLTVGTVPSISTQPVSPVTISAGQSAAFSVVATGTAPLAYQWSRYGVPVSGATNATITFTNAQSSDAGAYTVDVTNAYNLARSNVGSLTVTAAAPTVTAAPQSLSVVTGQGASFSVSVTGTSPFTYQWKKGGVNISGATVATLTLANVQNSDAGSYTVVITNGVNSTTSAAATLTVTTKTAATVMLGGLNATYDGSTHAVTATTTPSSLTVDFTYDGSAAAPTNAGTYAVVGTINDASYQGTASGSLVIAKATQSGLSVNSPASVTYGTAYTATTTGGSGTGAVSWALGAGSTASGATINTTSGVVGATGAGTVVINATKAPDANYLSATSPDFSITLLTPYYFTTMAGSPGVSGSTDGTGSVARFNSPVSVALDHAGNVYLVDMGNNVLRKITPAGVVTVFAGSAGLAGSTDATGSAASFNDPLGLAVDSADSLYVADQSNNTIRKITPAGVVTTFAGSAGLAGSTDAIGSNARFNDPVGVAVDGSDNVYVADIGNYTIRKITPSGDVTTLAGSAGLVGSIDATGSAARFEGPGGLAVDAAGNVYVADVTTIRMITPGGVVTTLAGTSGLAGSIDGTGSTARFDTPFGLALDGAGNVYVTDVANSTIRMITPSGVVTTIAGTPGVTGATDGLGSAAQFDTAFGVAVDGAGYLYVADLGNQTIRKGHLPFAPAFSTQPATQSVSVGAPVTFTAAATGWPVPTYQWQYGGVDIPGATALSYALSSPVIGDAGNYQVVATNAVSSTTSNVAVLTVNKLTQTALTISSAASGTFGQIYTASVSGGSGTGALVWSLGAGSTAPGVAIDPTTGVGSSSGAGTLVINATKAADANYLSATTADFTVTLGKAAGTVTLGNLSATYDGSVHAATATTTPSSLTVDITYSGSPSAPTIAGTYTVVGTINDGNYQGFASGSLVIAKAVPVVTWNTPVAIPYGTALSSVQLNATANVAGAFVYSPASGTILGIGAHILGVTFTPTDGTNYADASAQQALTVNALIQVRHDFDGDGKSDIFLSNTVTGDRAVWFMNGTVIGTNAFAGTVPVEWTISATGDFNGDGKADLFWTNTVTGDRAMWLMNGNTNSGGGYLGAVPVEWTVGGTGDFDGDGKTDVLWTNTVTGERAIWLMNGSTLSGGASLGLVPVEWAVNGTGDFNGDGKEDILLSNAITGDRVIWFMNGTLIGTNAFAGTVPVAWSASGVGDFDGDGKADIFWTNTTTGDRAVWLMNGSAISAGGYLGAIPVVWSVSGAGDYNGDGKADILWTNTATGERAMWLMNGVTTSGGASLGVVPAAWVIVQ